jgi:UDP-perosamine 4-acetyltransferase
MTEQKEKILIIGAGVHAEVILNMLLCYNDNEIVGFTDITKKKGDKILGYPILGTDSIILDLANQGKIDSVIIGLGYKLLETRQEIFNFCKKNNIKLTKAIHPSAIISITSTIGEGVAIMAGAIINPNTIIGDNTVINTGAIIDHNNIIGNNVFIQIGAKLAGNVVVHDNTIVGMGSNILEKLEIGSNSIIGAGSVVLKNILNNQIVAGVPAKILRNNI